MWFLYLIQTIQEKNVKNKAYIKNYIRTILQYMHLINKTEYRQYSDSI